MIGCETLVAMTWKLAVYPESLTLSILFEKILFLAKPGGSGFDLAWCGAVVLGYSLCSGDQPT